MAQHATEAPTAVTRHRRDGGGMVWFTFMVGMWSAFCTLLLASPETLDDIWDWLTGLSLGVEILMWILLLPWALALAVWESSWPGWLQLFTIALLGAGWTALAFPRAKS
jgi:hypothetical protein